MPEILTMQEIDKKKAIQSIKDGAIFIYPTDTVYGLGCNALNEEAINRIRIIKGNYNQPFSVIAPSIRWVQMNLYAKNNYLKKLPGPFTFVFKIRKKCVNKTVNLGLKTLGIRIPKHEFTKLVEKAGIPFVTTSVNLHGKKPLREIKNLSRNIMNQVDYIIDGGYLPNYPSTIIDLTGKIAKIVRR